MKSSFAKWSSVIMADYFSALLFSVGVSSHTLTRAWSARGRSAGFRGQLWRVYPSVFRVRAL